MTINDDYGFLGHLPLTRYPYEGKEQCWSIFWREWDRLHQDPAGQNSSGWLLFEIDEKTCDREFLNTDDRDADKAWSAWSASENLLLIKMGLLERAVAAGLLNTEIMLALQYMGLDRAVEHLTWRCSVQGDKKEKKADLGWGPLRPSGGRGQEWPALAVEVAGSDCQAKLNSDIRFWLHESRGETKVLLTMRINRCMPAIAIEKWELQNDQIQRTQDIAISKDHGQVIVRGDPLVIEFHKLMGRPPNPGEADIKLGRETLEEMAKTIWNDQKFER